MAVFHGSRRACAEAGLVLESKGIAYEAVWTPGSGFALLVEPAAAPTAREELSGYVAERPVPRAVARPFEPLPGTAVGVCLYAALLLAVAWCAGVQLLGVDWLDAGALEASGGGVRFEAWRTVTALTLHLDELHLLGNLMFGVGVGALAGRVFGPGVAWLGTLAAAVIANALEMALAPPTHRAVGASTAVFAALGLLSGFAWHRQLGAAERYAYRFGPLFAGVCLLALLGAGDAQVDVLGHALGFAVGVALGWAWARIDVPRARARALQPWSGALALLIVVLAWAVALEHALPQRP